MSENKNELANVEEMKVVSGFITEAITKGLPVETMEKLFALRTKAKEEYAKEQFMLAMASFQKECPIIEKKKVVLGKDGSSVRYKYAPLDDIVDQVKKPLGTNNLSYDFITFDEKEYLTVTCTVTHALGYSKSSSFKVPVGTEAYMTDVQKYGARITFAKRYAFCNALGILTGDEDTDAKEDGKKKVEPVDLKAKIVSLLKEIDPKIKTAEQIRAKITKLTQLSPDGDDRHLNEIISRLNVIISELKPADDLEVIKA